LIFSIIKVNPLNLLREYVLLNFLKCIFMLFIEKKFVYEEIDFEEESWMNEKKNKRRRKSLRNRRVKKKLRKV